MHHAKLPTPMKASSCKRRGIEIKKSNKNLLYKVSTVLGANVRGTKVQRARGGRPLTCRALRRFPAPAYRTKLDRDPLSPVCTRALPSESDEGHFERDTADN